MTNRLHVTPELLVALEQLGRGLIVSKTKARTLAKLGWVTVRVTKVYDGTEKRKLYRYTVTSAGRAALHLGMVAT